MRRVDRRMVDHSSVQSVKLNVRAFRGRYRALHLHSFIIRPDLFSSIRACSSVRPDGSERHRVLPSGSEERSDAQRRLPREHGEHRIFPAVKLATCGIAQHLYQGPKRLTALGWAICLTVMAGPFPRALTLGLARPSTAAVGNTRKTWMAGTGPAMTTGRCSSPESQYFRAPVLRRTGKANFVAKSICPVGRSQNLKKLVRHLS